MKELDVNSCDVELARSLSADTTELLPYLLYTLQDYWELGSDPEVMVQLIEKFVSLSDNTRILDLACGKGAVSVKAAERLWVRVKGIDITPAFIEYAERKAKEHSVGNLCYLGSKKRELLNEEVYRIAAGHQCRRQKHYKNG